MVDNGDKIPQHLDDRPEVKFLNRHLKEQLCAKNTHIWKDLGVELLGEGNNDALDIIENKHSDVTIRCSDMFKLWLERQPTASWRKLIQALEQLQFNYLASQIESKLTTPHLEHTTDHGSSMSQKPSLLTNNQLRAEFSHLLMRIRHILSQSPKWEDNLEACKELCIYLKASDNTEAPLFNKEKQSEIDNCGDFREFFGIVNQHLSWDEHSILAEIINECDSEEAEQEFSKYKRKRAISKALEIISSTESDPPPGFEKFCVIIDKPYVKLTVEKYEEIKAFIFDNLDIHRYVTNGYIRVLFDSLHLEWHVTTQATPHMIKMAHERRSFFVAKFCIFMQIGNKVIIDIHADQILLDQNPFQVNLDVKITYPNLLVQQQYLVAGSIQPEQQMLVLLLEKINYIVDTYVQMFLSASRKELSRPFAQFEGMSFKQMTDMLIYEDKLHCFDVSYIQQFLLHLLNWDALQGSQFKESIINLLKEAQDYEPVPTGFPLPSLQLHSVSQTVVVVTNFSNVYCVSYEVMMTLKYALSQLLCLSLLTFQYISWTNIEGVCQINWKTFPDNSEKIVCKLSCLPSTAALTITNYFVELYQITVNCNIENMQILLDGSPLLYPDIDDCSLNFQLDMIHRVGHVCAACFIDYNWAFRLLWLQCFKPHEHQYAGKVNAVYNFTKSALSRVRNPPTGVMQQCLGNNCTNGRKCIKAHSSIEFEYWRIQQSGRGQMNYKVAVTGKSRPVEAFTIIKNYSMDKISPSFPAIKDALSPSNYCNKFHHLLFWEELQHVKELNKGCTDSVDVVICDDISVAQSFKLRNQYAMIGYVVMKDADSAKYVIQTCQTITLMLTDREIVEVDVVSILSSSKVDYFLKLNMKDVPIALNDINAAIFKAYCIGHQRGTSKPITRVKTKFNHQYFQNLHQVLDNIPQLIIQKLFPSVSDAKKIMKGKSDYDCTNMQSPFRTDKLQSEAIFCMLSVSAKAPFLLLGPFGTGKTHVLTCVAAAFVSDPDARVLIATHCDKSADKFISKYFGTIESTKTLPPTVAPIRIVTKRMSDDVENRPYFFRFNDPMITKELLDERRIVVTTFLTALHFASAKKVSRGYFTHILIDEGTQTCEPETIAPLIFADERTKIIIAGDHLQIGPRAVVLGEETIKNGLADSLVERLYSCYHDNSNQQCPWIFNILSNYQNHAAIMRLPSNLFYNSTVVSKSDSKLHPHTCYPLHFVCTSLKDGTFQDVSDVHYDEADVVLNQVKKYTESWPRKSVKSSVGIVASNRNQVIQLQSKLKKLHIDSHSCIEVLSSFDLQGREFSAIFVSTTEATDNKGCCKYPAESMTVSFVFNTLITRAQSLVVCVGNPYFLCHLEKNTNPRNECWSTYINYCLDCETLTVLNCKFGQMEKEKLQSVLYLNSKSYLKQKMTCSDKIIKGYLNSLAQFELHKKALKFFKPLRDTYEYSNDYKVESDDDDAVHYDDDDDGNNDSYSDDDDDNDDDNDDDDDDDDNEQEIDYSELYFNSYIRCVVDLHSHYQALAQSVKHPDLIIHINGQKNLRGAFHESTVLVELVDSPNQSQRKNERKVYNGKVVKLISLSNQTFLCEVDNHMLHKFYPINKKDPAFYNLPPLSKVENGAAVFEFDSQSLEDVPRVVQVFPPPIARKRIFIIQYLYWNYNKFPNPVGIVIDSISKGYTYSAGEKLLCAQYKFNFTKVSRIFNSVELTHPHNPDKVFAIIERSAEILENAFSIKAINKDTYIISYYVVNIAKCIEDKELLSLLKNRGVSAYVKTDKLNAWKLHSMFPHTLLKKLNFSLNKPRPCFKISCLAEAKRGNITYKPLEENFIKEVSGILTEVCTLKQMENQIETRFEFTLLFHIAQCLQLKRLDYVEAKYNCVFDILETPRAQLVLKAFSSWANSLVAMKLADSSLSLFPLHCKFPPNPEEKKSVYDNHGDALQTSLHNKYFLPKNGYETLLNVKINSEALPLLIEALKDQNTFKYLAILAYDNFFPQFHVASHKFRSIEKVKEFVLCSDTDSINFDISHDSACYTTRFVSPLTSYFDIVMQDMLSASLNLQQTSKYNRTELNLMCGKANKDFKRKSDFEDSMFNLQLGVTLKAFNHRITGYIVNINNKNRLTLSFPSHELKTLSEHQSSFNIAHLLALKCSVASTSVYEWNVIVASFNTPPSIFNSPTIILKNKLKDADATIDITVFTVSGEEERSHFNIELDKEPMVGSVESSSVSVNQDEWQKLTKFISEDIEQHCKNALKILSSHCTKHSQGKHFEQIAKKTVFWSGTVKRKLQQKYDSLHAWFGAAQDTALVYPKIQQIEIAPFLKVCIQHNSEPEKCFANISLVNASKKTYEDIDEYMELWGQVVIAENAVSSVRTRDILLLENVYLQWPELEYCCDSYAGDYYRVPKNEFVIMKPPIDFNRSNIELFDLQRGELLCIQYEVPDKELKINMGFVFHMFVDKVSICDVATEDIQSDRGSSDHESSKDSFSDNNSNSNEHEKVYYLSFSQSIEKISEKFKRILASNPCCNVQIFRISSPQRRIYRCVRSLRTSSNMIQGIACGDSDVVKKAIEGSKFSIEEINLVFKDKNIESLWDKPPKKLSTNQMTILRKACTSKFLIIYGPPGSGKSTVGAHLAYTFAKLNQNTTKNRRSKKGKTRCVVYCGASNTSIDVVAKMLCDLSEHKDKQQKHHADKLKVLRVYPNAIEQSLYPNPFDLLHDSETSSINENLNSSLKALKFHSLHYKIRYECGNLGETIKAFEKNFDKDKQKKKYASKADRLKYNQTINKAENKILSDNIDILICTCNEMASGRIFHNIEAIQVIIDEAAMVTEPESMIPIRNAEQIILIGDHQQLQPKVQSKHAERNGLITSLFQRYVDDIMFDFCFLPQQFRMHEMIFKFPAREFYEKHRNIYTNKNTKKEMEVKAKKTLKTFWPNQDPTMPFVFCDVIGTEEVTDAEFIDKIRVGQESKYNPKEADKIVEIVKVLVINYGVKQHDILALSPYQAQCKHIYDKLKSNKFSEVKCTTVKSSEGNECGIVLLSTVRSLPLEDIEDPEALIPDRRWLSENLGFLTDKHIINVGITRCKYGLVIVGNKCLLEYDETWRSLIYYCSKQDNVVLEKQFPSRSDVEKMKNFSVKR